MAFSVKKGKKNKGTVISLQSFLSDGDAPVGTTQVAKNIRNSDGDDSDDGGNVVVCQLPTAPRASRIFDDNSIPQKAPFIAYVTNLPFDVKEDDIYEYFSSYRVITVRLPREDGETGRVRGFGYVEFEAREDLIESLGIPDPTIKGRRIRIDLSNENENSRQRGGRRGYDSSNSENRDSTNWRRDNMNQKRDTNNFGFERSSFNSDMRSDDKSQGGSWRMGNRSAMNENISTNRTSERERDPQIENKNNIVQERPKLNLKPRTLPLPELEVNTHTEVEPKVNNNEDISTQKFVGVSAEKVFGSAKPVDTTARDLEIEERLTDIRRQEKLRKEVLETTDDLKELSLEKTEKVSEESNWRRKDVNEDTSKDHFNRRNTRPDRRRENVRDNRYKYQEKSERSDNLKELDVDGKRKDGTKNKRDYKVERPLPKYTPNQGDPVLQSSNKYSGLDDASD